MSRRTWLSSGLRQDVIIATVSGLVVGLVFTLITEVREDARVARAERLENLRFVRAATEPAQRKFGALDLTGLSLAGLDLGGADLRRADLTEANLDAVNLAGAEMGGTTYTEARLRGARLTDVTTGCVRFDDEADPACTDFTEALLSNADFTGADLTGADFTGAALDGAVFTDVRHGCDGPAPQWPDGFDPPPSAPC